MSWETRHLPPTPHPGPTACCTPCPVKPGCSPIRGQYWTESRIRLHRAGAGADAEMGVRTACPRAPGVSLAGGGCVNKTPFKKVQLVSFHPHPPGLPLSADSSGCGWREPVGALNFWGRDLPFLGQPRPQGAGIGDFPGGVAWGSACPSLHGDWMEHHFLLSF